MGELMKTSNNFLRRFELVLPRFAVSLLKELVQNVLCQALEESILAAQSYRSNVALNLGEFIKKFRPSSPLFRYLLYTHSLMVTLTIRISFKGL